MKCLHQRYNFINCTNLESLKHFGNDSHTHIQFAITYHHSRIASTSGDELVPPGPGADEAFPPVDRRLTPKWSLTDAFGVHCTTADTPEPTASDADEVGVEVIVAVMEWFAVVVVAAALTLTELAAAVGKLLSLPLLLLRRIFGKPLIFCDFDMIGFVFCFILLLILIINTTNLTVLLLNTNEHALTHARTNEYTLVHTHSLSALPQQLKIDPDYWKLHQQQQHQQQQRLILILIIVIRIRCFGDVINTIRFVKLVVDG